MGRKKRYTQAELERQDRKSESWYKANSLLLKDSYKSVKEITVRYKKQTGSFSRAWGKEWCVMTIRPNDRFYCYISCASWSCVHGGFNMTGLIRGLVLENIKFHKGESTCCGWEDAERVDKFHCDYKIMYEIEISYLPDSGHRP